MNRYETWGERPAGPPALQVLMDQLASPVLPLDLAGMYHQLS